MAEALAARTGGGGAGPRTIDEGAEHMVRAERGSPPAQVLQRWRDSATAVTSLLRSTDGHDRVTWVAGELSVRTLAVTRLTETWIHTGDVAGALAIKLEPAGRLRHVARLAWRTLPYAFARAGRQMAGPVAFELDGPGGESWDLRLGGQAATTVRGDGVELCLLAARRVEPASTSLEADGPDGAAVLELVRTYA